MVRLSQKVESVVMTDHPGEDAAPFFVLLTKELEAESQDEHDDRTA